MSDEICGHPKRDAEPCGVDFALCECHGQCYHHAPCRASERKKARSRGGKASGGHNRKPPRVVLPDEAPPPPKTSEDATNWLSWLTHARVTGMVDSDTARDCGYLLRAFMESLERGELADEVDELREKVSEMQREKLKAM